LEKVGGMGGRHNSSTLKREEAAGLNLADWTSAEGPRVAAAGSGSGGGGGGGGGGSGATAGAVPSDGDGQTAAAAAASTPPDSISYPTIEDNRRRPFWMS
jgi:hypothetical protein